MAKRAAAKVIEPEAVIVEFVAGPGAPFEDGEEKVIGELVQKHIAHYGGVLDLKKLYDEVEHDLAHPLRRFLQWDDKKAAIKYRLEQLKKVLRFVRYRVELGETTIESRVWQTVKVTDELPGVSPGKYLVPTSTVIQHESLSTQILERSMKELRAWQERYRMHLAFCGPLKEVFDGIDEWEKKHFRKP